ncbi:MAG: four helix bundle protein [Kiritimatiellia bacterium]
MRIDRFEDIEGWKQARNLAKMAYAATKKGPFSHDFGLKDQTQRASVSIMLNIAEGFDSGGSTEFIKFLRYAQRSCTEVQSALYVALDQEYVSEDEFAALYKQAQVTRAIIGGFVKYLLTQDRRKPAPPIDAPATKNQELRTKN